VTKADSTQELSKSYLTYSIALLALLLGVGLTIGLAAQSASRHVEGYLVDMTGRGLAQSATALAESLNRVLFEHALQSRTIAQAPLLRSGDSDTLATYLRNLKAAWPDYMHLQVVDAGGRVVAATDSSQVGGDASRQGWYKTLVEGGRLDLHGPDLFDPARRTMLFPAPIVGEEGQFLGAVVLQVGLQSMEFILDGARRSPALRSSPRVEYRLVANDGAVLYDSIPHDGMTERRASFGGGTDNGVVKPGYREERHPQRNIAVVTGFAPVNRYGQVPGWQWTLLIRMDREAILTPFHRLVATMMIWGGIGILVFVAALLWIIGRLRQASDMPRRKAVSIPAPSTNVKRPLARPVQRGESRTSLHKPPTAPRQVPHPSNEPVVVDPERWEELRRWIRLAEVNRVCLFKNHRGADNELWVSRRYEWIGLGEVARTEWSQWFSWSLRAKGFSRWEHTLAQGQVVSGAVAMFPPAEAAALMSCGIHTVFVAPLLVHGEWWGFVEFDHCFTDRVWSEPELRGLRAMVDLLHTVLQQTAGEEQLQSLLATIDTVLESTADGILVVDGHGNLVTFNQRLVSMWNMPDAVTESRLTEEMMGWIMRQLKVPDVLLRTMSELGSEPEADSYDILELQDGRMVERLSKPRRDGDRCDGRIWIFRESIALKPSTLSVHSSQ
jgi:PAS domain-containing protein